MQDSTTPTATEPARKAKRIIIVGVIAGGVITSGLAFGAMSANAATTPTPSAAAAAATTDTPAPSGTSHGHGHGLNLSGTVTAVGTGSVTVKTATATTEYAVSATSDIDKNGEATIAAPGRCLDANWSVRAFLYRQTNKPPFRVLPITRNQPLPASGSGWRGPLLSVVSTHGVA